MSSSKIGRIRFVVVLCAFLLLFSTQSYAKNHINHLNWLLAGHSAMHVPDTLQQRSAKLTSYIGDVITADYRSYSNSPAIKQSSYANIFYRLSESTDSNLSETIRNLESEINNCLAEPVAYTISADYKKRPALTLKSSVSLQNPTRFRRLLSEATGILAENAPLDLFKDMGVSSFKVSYNIDIYKSVLVRSAEFSFDSDGIQSPRFRTIRGIYGDSFQYRWAIKNDFFVCAVGSDPNSAILDLIDRADYNSSAVGSVGKTARALLPGANQTEDLLSIFNPLNLFNISSVSNSVQVAESNSKTNGQVYALGKAQDSSWIANVGFPIENTQEFIETVFTPQLMLVQPQPVPIYNFVTPYNMQ